MENILITGGAGFIGSHLADALISQGHEVTVFDVLHPQVHATKQRPQYLNESAKLIVGDVRNRELLAEALVGKTVVYHFAAYTGVGQSMYQIEEYMDVNVRGTAVLLELLSQQKPPVHKLIVASSRAIYGEGSYTCSTCGLFSSPTRTLPALQQAQWELVCPACGAELQHIPTPETQVPDPCSIYAASKLNQEQISLLIGQAYQFPVVALRYFNVYGPRQSFTNPYTGVITTFISKSVNQRPSPVYEDGAESRDFVHVQDVVQACILAMENDAANNQVLNVGSGESISMLYAAQIIAQKLNAPDPVITGQFRVGDIRHCYADLSRSRSLLGFKPQISFSDGIDDLLAFISETSLQDVSQVAASELKRRGLLGKQKTF